jgi:hypothetical protein
MREVTVDCDSCGARMPIERAKEALISEGNNKFHLIDLCPTCLDKQMQNASAVNDTDGYRQQAAALITPA